MQIKKSSKKLYITIVVILLSLVLIGILLFVLSKTIKKDTTATKKPPVNKAKVTAVQSKILFTGNSFWGRYTNDKALKSSQKYNFPFARLDEFGRNDYNAWITGVECPITQKGTKMTSADMEKALQFNCDPAYVSNFARYFTAVTLANNHTDNQGEDGFLETQKHLEDNHIQYFGHYDPGKTEDICEVISLPVTVSYDDGSQKDQAIPVALCGLHFVFKLPTDQAILEITKYAEQMPTIVMPHGGAEYKPAPDEIKTTLYHNLIDAGADMIIGDHPHWVQNTEAYKDRLIVYSMGNFMFDQQFNDEVTRSAAINVNLKSNDAVNQQLTEWLEIGKDCAKYKDDCLEKSKQQKLKKLNLLYKFKAIATSDKGYQTHPAPELQDAVEGRLNWKKTMQDLRQADN